MFGTIKSKYIIKIIISILDEKGKLKLLKYNKNLQKIMNINIINYITLSQKYIIYEIDGKGKEYNGYDDNLLFEGEYKNEKRNGKGIEYDGYNGTIMFEGEYLNGKRNGWGKDYNFMHILIFEVNI